jgi:hypothetical protein
MYAVFIESIDDHDSSIWIFLGIDGQVKIYQLLLSNIISIGSQNHLWEKPRRINAKRGVCNDGFD